jgi:hypothetical protein
MEEQKSVEERLAEVEKTVGAMAEELEKLKERFGSHLYFGGHLPSSVEEEPSSPLSGPPSRSLWEKFLQFLREK